MNSFSNTASPQASKRIERLKERFLTVLPSIQINRALAFTEVYKAEPEQAPILLRAKGFKRACETAPLRIDPDELIVGHPCGKARAGSFSPDTAWKWLAAELDEIGSRSQDPYQISESDKKIMREELFPFWQGKSIDEACEKAFREAGLWEFSSEAFISDLSYHHTSGGGDTSPGFDNILLKKGISGIMAEAQTALSQATDRKQKEFYQAAIINCEGVLIYSKRISDYAKKLAKQEEPGSARKSELEDIAAINARVPREIPETFHEALQAIWTIQSLFLLEENQCSSSLGRFDQYLWPLFESDCQKGRITPSSAKELLGCFFIKCSEVIWYTPGDTAKYFAGYMPFINLTVGGVKRQGGDGTNELTYLVMDCINTMGLYQPSLSCRIHNNSPRRYLEKVVDVIKNGAGMPACHFDDAHIKMMLRKGFDFEDARDYCIMGCVEPQKSGKTHQWTAGGFSQWPVAIEFVLNRGILRCMMSKQGLDTGTLEQFTSYELFEAAVKKQLDHIITMTGKGTRINQELVRDLRPTPYMSLFIEGCMESGKDATAGGAFLYDGPGTIFAGLATYADSMAAIKKVVFEDKRYTLHQLAAAIESDWQGYEEMQEACRKAPKFGNNDDFVDQITTDIIDYTEKRINQERSLYARMIHGTLSQSFNTPLGEMIGATPNGRKAGAPLSDGMSPSQGADTKGPTAIIKSVSKLNVESMSLGMSHNFKLLPGSLESKEEIDGLIELLYSASIAGNAQMQFNYVDNETLRQAQQNPDEYRGLIVRVAGYSAFFVELCQEVQDEIISRNSLTC